MREINKKLFYELAKKIDVELKKEQIDKYEDFMCLLLDWNDKINLTAITDEKDIIIKHFIDSLTSLKYIGSSSSIIDVGSGAGFPGIPISIQKTNLNITLLDSLNKRINFLNEVTKKINLNNVVALHGRAEEFGQNKNYREKYDIAISRAVANLSTLTEYLIPFVKVNGKIICMKGPDIEQELKESEKAIRELGGKVERVDNFILPGTDIKRNLIIIKKVNNTPEKYPRKAGTPSKEPIK